MRPSKWYQPTIDLELLAEAKRCRHVSVCLPAKNEAATVGAIVARIVELGERWGLVDEVLVVNDHSTDETAHVAASAGATVIGVGAGATGKGEALWTAVGEAKGDVLVFCDADLRHFDGSFVTGLLAPLLLREDVGFVKARYERPGDGGRVTELVARPLLSLLFPELERFRQPLAGEFAGRREVLEAVPFVQGYGVDLALLIDVVRLIGVDAVAEVDLGLRYHRNRPLAELRHEAEAVLAAGLNRAGVGPPVPERPPLRQSR